MTGAPNQHGEVLPVGGINEKIERVPAPVKPRADGMGALILARNQRHLMLEPRIVQAVAQGRFHPWAVQHVSEGIALLTGQARACTHAA